MDSVLVFDGDDTLWSVEPLYDEARANIAEIVEREGLDSQEWESVQRELDVRLVETLGLADRRFPTSNIEAYEYLVLTSGGQVNASTIAEIAAAAQSVFNRRAPLVDGAEAALRSLRGSHSLVLLTKGELWVQRRRIEESGLAEYFSLVKIVDVKTPALFRNVVKKCGGEIHKSYSIGNSFVSDIRPATKAGLRAIWIDAPVWEYERRERPEPGGYIQLTKLSDLPNALRRYSMLAEA